MSKIGTMNMRDMMAMATVFVSPGRPSGFGMTLNELLEPVLLWRVSSLNILRTRLDRDPIDILVLKACLIETSSGGGGL